MTSKEEIVKAVREFDSGLPTEELLKIFSIATSEGKNALDEQLFALQKEGRIYPDMAGWWHVTKKAEKESEPTKPKDERKHISSSFLNIGGKLYEQCYNPKTEEVYFITLSDDGKYEDEDQVEAEGGEVVYHPVKNDAIKTGALMLPLWPEEYGSVTQLVDEIQRFIHKYVDISEEHERFAAWYVLLSWVYDRFNTIPYLRPIGDTGTGKSRYEAVIGMLLYKPSMMAGAVTAAPIYRTIKTWGGSLVIDEADFKKSDAYNDVITILNCGFEKGKPVMRCDKDDPDNIQYLPTFCPKVIATRFTFDDKALESRCLTEQMRQTRRTDIPPLLPNAFYEEQRTLANKLLDFRMRNWHKIDPEVIQTIDLGELEPRIKQAMSAFAVLFGNMPEIFDKFKTYLQQYQGDLIEERSTSFEGQVVNAIFDMTNESKGDISSKDIAEKVTETYNYIKPVTAQSVGRVLKSLKVKTNRARIGSENRRFIVYEDDHFATLFKRYVVSEKLKPVPTVPSVPTTWESAKDSEQTRLVPLNAHSHSDGTNGTHGTRCARCHKEAELVSYNDPYAGRQMFCKECATND